MGAWGALPHCRPGLLRRAHRTQLLFMLQAWTYMRADVSLITGPAVLWFCTLVSCGRYLGSSDDATIGDDFVGEKTNCPAPRPIPTPEVHAPRAYANQYPNRASLNEDPAFFHPLQCQWQYQQRLTVRTERGPQQTPRLLPLAVWELSFCVSCSHLVLFMLVGRSQALVFVGRML